MPPAPNGKAFIQIDAGQCVACAICVDVCLPAALRLPADSLVPVLQPVLCTRCGACEHECPTRAIVLTAST